MLYVHDDDDIMEQTEKGVELAMRERGDGEA